ncbi:MOSC domain-containing protein [Methylomonas rosea]|uniref:MOSC domain-containing protein n=1 Tax=Methylomonas rosea TaxID=2952227 RepID=A0ABT1TSQ7_9GAMM|nr:MOSC N-terminal beta barrel domain-containing protein [Methylomonas sp. WSC-7]MCQ8117108.1 MOSC domain-containing protein [Methylomonas sp. WSC-7]
MPILSEIYVYPVKSLAGIRVAHWPVDHKGLLYDRKWMLIDSDRQFLSQRRLPKMALIKTCIADQQLILSAPNQADLALPLQALDGDDIEVVVWHDRCIAKTCGDNADAWLSDFLQTDCRLVYQTDDDIRKVDPNYALDSDQTSFSDGFPFLIVSENSLNALNQAMPLAIDMIRFRPNLVVADCDSYAEDTWRRLTINDIGFRLPKPCSRCSVPTIDPLTAETGKEPLTTLNRLRKWQNKVYFGQNALHDKPGSLSVGQTVLIDEIGEPQPPLSPP